MKNFSAQIKASIIILFTVIISVSAFLHLKKNNFNCLSWDTYGYYLYLPSTFIYDDPGVENLKKYEELNSKYNSTATFYQFSPGKDGKNVIKYSSGLSFVFLPFFTVAHFSAGWFGYAQDGFSPPYQWAIYISFWLISLLGIFLTWKMLLLFFKRNIAFYTLTALLFGTNILFLMGFPMSIHIYLYTFYCGLIITSYQWNTKPTFKNSILLGFLTGFIMLIRPTDAVALLIPVLWNIYSLQSLKDKLILISKNKAKVFISIAIAFLLFLPQMLYWKYTTGLWFYNSYTNPGEGLDFLNPHIFDFLFSFRKGWLIYTPLMIFAIIGIYYMFKKNRSIFYPILFFFLINLYLVSAWTNWWYAGSFSSRAIAQSYAVMVLPLGYFIEHIFALKKTFRYGIVTLFAFFIFLNIFQTWQYKEKIIHPERMTKKYYFATLFRTSPVDDETKKLLLVERSATGIDTISNPEDYLFSKTIVIDYMNDASIDSSRKRNADTSSSKGILMDSLNIFTPAFRLPFNEITDYDHAYIKVTADIFPTKPLTENPLTIVTTFEYEGQCYNYKSQLPISDKPIIENKWNKVEVVYMTPEPRSEKDLFTTYFWLTGKDTVFVSNISLEIFDPFKYGIKR